MRLVTTEVKIGEEQRWLEVEFDETHGLAVDQIKHPLVRTWAPRPGCSRFTTPTSLKMQEETARAKLDAHAGAPV
jgi:hypothetical protein